MVHHAILQRNANLGFSENNTEVLEWPGNSPDLNPIQNLWSRLKRAVAAKHPLNKQQLIEAVINSWFHIIAPEDLQKLVDSMPRRCEAVIKAVIRHVTDYLRSGIANGARNSINYACSGH